MSAIITLLNQVEDGGIVLPAIQRDFVWPERQVIRLIDSVLRGYPIGLVLLWETYADIQYRSFVKDYRQDAPHTFKDNDARRKLKLVLDGQQRLQSLFVALYGTYGGKELYFDLLSGFDVDDLSDDRFVLEFLTSAEASRFNSLPREEVDEEIPFLFMRTSELFRMTSRDRRALERAKTEELELRDDEVRLLEDNLTKFDDQFMRGENLIKAATIDENLVPDHAARKSEADVCEIFVRINREGTNLSRSDLIFSLLKLNWRESAEALPEFVRTVNLGNSLGIDSDFVIRCLFAVSGLGSKMDIELLRKRSNVALLQENFDRCTDAIRAAVDFVTQHCKCQSAKLAGGLNTLVPFVYYLFHLPNHEIPNRSLADAKRGFYLLAFTKPLSRYGDSRIGAYIRDVLRPNVEESHGPFPLARTYLRVVGWESIWRFDLAVMQRNVDLALHLVQGIPGGRVQYANNSPEIDHIFPGSVLRRKGVDDLYVNSLANYWILPRGKNRNKSNRHPAEYLSDVDDALLERALIDRDMLDYRRYRTFIKTRGAAIEAAVRQKVRLPEMLVTRD